jgi:hypothetical protein
MTMTSRGGGGSVSCADQYWLTALNQLQPTYSVSEGKASWLPDCCLIKARLLNIWLLPSRDARDCEC